MEIADWPRGLSLERYAGTFRDNAIDVAVLPELSESDLEKLGVLLGHRKIMLRAIAALRGGAAENIAEPVPASAPIPRWRTNPGEPHGVGHNRQSYQSLNDARKR